MRLARKAQAAQFAANILLIIREVQAAGHTSLNAIAGRLNARKSLPLTVGNGGKCRYGRYWLERLRMRESGRVVTRRPPAVVLHHLDERRGCSTGWSPH
jgi:hypothetical protein